MSRTAAAEPFRVPVFAVIGGGADGAFYVRQLRRAIAKGRLATDAILVVDRDPRCQVAKDAAPPVRTEVADWSEWLDRQLDRLPSGSQLVPHHWAPHLLRNWLARQASQAGFDLTMVEAPSAGILAPGLRYQRAAGAGDRALSYADWTCPRTCIEPQLCPHTRKPRDWSLVSRLAAAEAAAENRIVFRSLHFAYGVATIPVAEILDARRQLIDTLGQGSGRVMVATASHCHGLAALLRAAPNRRAEEP